jgi:hypothetical protein
MPKASILLEAFIDETIKRAREKGYFPTIFVGMRQKLGTITAITKLVGSGDIQSGFRRLNKLGLSNWTIEAAVEKFPNEFSSDDLKCASFRLRLAREKDQTGC